MRLPLDLLCGGEGIGGELSAGGSGGQSSVGGDPLAAHKHVGKLFQSAFCGQALYSRTLKKAHVGTLVCSAPFGEGHGGIGAELYQPALQLRILRKDACLSLVGNALLFGVVAFTVAVKLLPEGVVLLALEGVALDDPAVGGKKLAVIVVKTHTHEGLVLRAYADGLAGEQGGTGEAAVLLALYAEGYVEAGGQGVVLAAVVHTAHGFVYMFSVQQAAEGDRGVGGADNIVAGDHGAVGKGDGNGSAFLRVDALCGHARVKHSSQTAEALHDALYHAHRAAHGYSAVVAGVEGVGGDKGDGLVAGVEIPGHHFPYHGVGEASGKVGNAVLAVFHNHSACRCHGHAEADGLHHTHLRHGLFAGDTHALGVAYVVKEQVQLLFILGGEGEKLCPCLFKVTPEVELLAVHLQHIEIWLIEKLGLLSQHADVIPDFIEIVVLTAVGQPVDAVVDVVALPVPAGTFAAGHGVLFVDFCGKALLQGVDSRGESGDACTDDYNLLHFHLSPLIISMIHSARGSSFSPDSISGVRAICSMMPCTLLQKAKARA